ncbi:MAG: acyl-CoA dehydrogenase family protein [Pseudomonadota bacterium]
MSTRPTAFGDLLACVRGIAKETAARHAADVDAKARFPQETVDELKRVGALSAGVPRAYGGMGCNLLELATLCAALSGACASSGMVLAMHYIQVACIVRHVQGSRFFEQYLRDLVREQYLLASMTSEVGTFGDTRSSICAVERQGERFVLHKDATTGSYCAHADGILVTCRRNPEAARSDQVLVLVRKGEYTLTQTTTWDTMGMRGTCSPGFKLESSGAVEQIVPGSFADGSAQSMVPYSHVLWSALWWGIAADAVGKAAAFVRAEARKTPGTLPPNAVRLADVSQQLQSLKHGWQTVAREVDELDAREGGAQELLNMGWALKFNNLKIHTSDTTPQLVHKALQIIGILAYKNDSPYALGRHYRDALSGALMISNERIAAKSAAMLMVFKDE